VNSSRGHRDDPHPPATKIPTRSRGSAVISSTSRRCCANPSPPLADRPPPHSLLRRPVPGSASPSPPLRYNTVATREQETGCASAPRRRAEPGAKTVVVPGALRILSVRVPPPLTAAMHRHAPCLCVIGQSSQLFLSQRCAGSSFAPDKSGNDD